MPWVDVIEAAYRLDDPIDVWLQNLATSFDRVLGDGTGTVAIAYSISPTGTIMPEGFQAANMTPVMQQVVMEISQRASAAAVEQTYLSHVVGSSSTAMSREVYEQTLAPAFPHGIRDGLGITCRDPTPSGVSIVIPRRDETRISRRIAALGSRAAAHINAARRLRGSRVPPTGDLPAGAEAVFDLRGRFEHAEGDAADAGARSNLRRAAIAIDHARSKRKRADDDAALEMWRALVAGRWTLIDRVDTDGRRLFVARKNDPEVQKHHALTLREQQVIDYVALGHSNKLIGYELGLTASTVGVHIAAAAAKLGVGTRGALIQTVLALAR